MTVIVAGHICLDIIPQLSGISREAFERSFTPGHLVECGPAALSTGGAVSNVGLALHRLDIPTQLMGKIGGDLFGQAVRQIVESYGPGLSGGMIVDPAAATSYTVIVNPPQVDRIFLHYAGPNDTFSADDVRYDLAAAAQLFHFGYPPLMRRMYQDGGGELAAILQRVRAGGATTSLDLTFPDPAAASGRADWAAILRRSLPFVDIFLPSIEEVLYMLRRPAYEALRSRHGADLLQGITPDLLADVADELLALGARIVGLKLGERGFYLRTAGRSALAGLGRAAPADPAAWADQELWAPCFRVEVVGTTGAGDATIAGFLAGLLRGLGPAEALTAAVAVGACNVEAADALSGVRPWDETLRRVAAGWSRHEMTFVTPGWRFNAERGLWMRERQNLPG
jgi:sugar/nucleoside kinase (ribokinase family)